MGGNGSGKTTLFNIITGFVKPQRGEIIFQTEKITHLSPYKINRKGIGRTFQDLRIITKLTVKENIILAMKDNLTEIGFNPLFPSRFFKNNLSYLEEKVKNIIDNYYLTGIENSLGGEISYGQQKLLSLACCVANEATHLLLDEPAAGIQPDYRNKIAILIKQLKAHGKTILLIEHNADFIDDVTDKIFFLHEGNIKAFNNIEEIRKDKQVMEAYI